MKKILIVSDSFRIGGIQKSLMSFLNNLDYSKYKIYLFLFNDQIKENIPKEVTLIKSNFILRIVSLTNKEAKERGVYIYILRSIFSVLCKIFGSNFIFNIIFIFTKKIKGMDIAISYSNNVNNNSLYFGWNKYVLKNVEANKKYSYLHVDYERMKLDTKINRKEYFKFDKILTVSEYTRKQFLKYYVNFDDKVVVLYNYLPRIDEKKLINPYNEKSFIIVSAGRLDENKNPLEQLKIARKLKEKKCNFKMFLIGDGILKNNLTQYINKYNLNNNVYLLGEKKDVYPYIKYANIYLSTSLSESFGLSICEALILNTIVVAKSYPALNEIIKDDNGFICHNTNEFASTLMMLYNDKKCYNKYKKKSLIRDFNSDNKKQVSELFDN